MREGGVKGKQRDQSGQKGEMLARESAAERGCERERQEEEEKHKQRERERKREKES